MTKGKPLKAIALSEISGRGYLRPLARESQDLPVPAGVELAAICQRADVVDGDSVYEGTVCMSYRAPEQDRGDR